jgi:hypothetical protein
MPSPNLGTVQTTVSIIAMTPTRIHQWEVAVRPSGSSRIVRDMLLLAVKVSRVMVIFIGQAPHTPPGMTRTYVKTAFQPARFQLLVTDFLL